MYSKYLVFFNKLSQIHEHTLCYIKRDNCNLHFTNKSILGTHLCNKYFRNKVQRMKDLLVGKYRLNGGIWGWMRREFKSVCQVFNSWVYVRGNALSSINFHTNHMLRATRNLNNTSGELKSRDINFYIYLNIYIYIYISQEWTNNINTPSRNQKHVNSLKC